MSAQLINLRQARKNKARATKARVAAENTAKFGRSKAAKELSAKRRDQHEAHLDAHQRDDR